MIGLGEGALTGVRVVDLSRMLGGPYCTQILGDHGADVIKVEPPAGDETRAWGPPFEDGTAAYFNGVNRNKRGVVLDLASEAGRERLLALLADADVMVENFRTGTLEKWGLAPEMLADRFPRLIHCRITGFGDDGPLGGQAGYDAVVQAASGLMSVNGEAGGGPLRVGVPVVDIATGMNAALGIVLALLERTRSGRGQRVEATLHDSAISLLHPQLVNYTTSGRLPARTGNAHPNICPYDAFPTATGPVFLAVGNDRQFARLAATLGDPTLAADPRFLTNPLRCEHRAALTEWLTTHLDRWSAEDLVAALIAAGVPAGPVADIAGVVAHPHTAHRGMIAEIGGVRAPAPPVRLSRTPATLRRAPPGLDADAGAIFGED